MLGSGTVVPGQTLSSFLHRNGLTDPSVQQALQDVGGVTSVSDLALLEEDDVQTICQMGRFNLLQRRKLLRAHSQALQENTNTGTIESPPTPNDVIPRVEGEQQRDPRDVSSDAKEPAVVDEQLFCVQCSQTFPPSQGKFSDEFIWYCDTCMSGLSGSSAQEEKTSSNDPSKNIITASQSGGRPDLQALAGLMDPGFRQFLSQLSLGGAGSTPMGPGQANLGDDDVVVLTPQNVLTLCGEIGIEATMGAGSQLILSLFGKVILGLQVSNQILAYAHFGGHEAIYSREERLKFCMKWNHEKTTTTVMVNDKGDFRMEMYIVFPETDDGVFLLKKDIVDILKYMRDEWNKAILEFSMEAHKHGESLKPAWA